MTTNPSEQPSRDVAVLCIDEILAGKEGFDKAMVDSEYVPEVYCGIGVPFTDKQDRWCCAQGKPIKVDGGYRYTCQISLMIEEIRDYRDKGCPLAEINDNILEERRRYSGILRKRLSKWLK